MKRHMEAGRILIISDQDEFERFNFKCLEGCRLSWRTGQDLTDHLQRIHHMDIEFEEKHFQNEEEFDKWKSAIEEHEACYYAKRAMRKSVKDSIRHYYYCNRSKRSGGNPITENRKRSMKRSGPCRLEHSCISNMVVTTTGNGLFVRRTVSHYGHEKDVRHIRLSKTDRLNITKKLTTGIPKERILEDTRNNIGMELKRIDLLSRQDVVNIKRGCGIEIEENVEPTKYATSIDMWVAECKLIKNNPVLFYKPHEISYLSIDGKVSLIEDDFCLIIMNSFQENLLKLYGSNIICVESTTNGPTNSDFQLTTIIVFDVFGDGFPVAYMFANKNDTSIYQLFFKTVKEKVGECSCNVFMSDVTSCFYTDWKNVMGEVKTQIYSPWHVDYAWRNNLKNIKIESKRESVHKSLKLLHTSVDFVDEEVYFQKLDEVTKTTLSDKDTEEFGRYFLKNYSTCYKKWGGFFLKKYDIDPNIQLGSFNKILKYFCQTGKTIPWLARVLHFVLKYTREKTMERLNTDGKRKEIVKEILKRHCTAIHCTFDVIEENNNKWRVTSVTNKDRIYEVQSVLTENCCDNKCSVCDVCTHRFSCSCPEFFIRNTICEHIHYICFKYLNNVLNHEMELNESNTEVIFDSAVCESEVTIYDGESEVITIGNGVYESEVTIELSDVDHEVSEVEVTSSYSPNSTNTTQTVDEGRTMVVEKLQNLLTLASDEAINFKSIDLANLKCILDNVTIELERHRSSSSVTQ